MIQNYDAVSQTAVYIQLPYGTFCVFTTKYQDATYPTSAPSHYIAYDFSRYSLEWGTPLCLHYCRLINKVQHNVFIQIHFRSHAAVCESLGTIWKFRKATITSECYSASSSVLPDKRNWFPKKVVKIFNFRRSLKIDREKLSFINP